MLFIFGIDLLIHALEMYRRKIILNYNKSLVQIVFSAIRCANIIHFGKLLNTNYYHLFCIDKTDSSLMSMCSFFPLDSIKWTVDTHTHITYNAIHFTCFIIVDINSINTIGNFIWNRRRGEKKLAFSACRRKKRNLYLQCKFYNRWFRCTYWLKLFSSRERIVEYAIHFFIA